jgi:competence protein ComEC
MKRPLTGLVVAFASGIWIGSLVNWPVPVVLYLAAGLLAGFLLVCRTRFAFAFFLASIFAVGVFAYRHAVTISSPTHITRLLERRDQNVIVRGVIVSDTGYRVEEGELASAERPRFELELQALRQGDQWQRADGRLLVFVSEAREPQPLRYGDVIECSAILRVPPALRNPGTFDWRAWLARRNIAFTATIRKSDLCEVHEHDKGNAVIALSLRLREYFERALRFGLEDDPKLTGVLAGMVIGQRSEIPPDTYADFQRTGVFHVFAINGLHVGLVTAVVLVILRTLRIPRRWCGVVAIPLLVLYVFATGAHPGAVRALVMACVWLIGWTLVRPTDSLNNLAAAALVILVFDPTQLFDGGFVLSFVVVIALVTLTPRIEAKFKALIAPDPLVPRQLLSPWRGLVESPAIWALRLVSASLAAWIGLLPLLAVYFHLFTPISILGNVLVIPLLGFIIALGLVSMLAYAVWPWLALALNNANFFILSTMIGGVARLGNLPYGHQFVQSPPLWMVWAYYVVGILLLSRWISWPRRRMAAAIAVPALGVALFLSHPREEVVEITVLDLNDGASIFLNAPGEQHDVLIDGGGDWSGLRVVIPFLRAQGVDRLARVVLTRGDKPHAAGLVLAVREIPSGEAMYSGVPSLSKFYRQWITEMRIRQIPIRTVHAGDEVPVAPDLRVRVLNPPRDGIGNRSADNSLVLALEFGPTRVLLMSDAGETVERRLLAGTEDLRAQLVIKGRHEKESSCTDEFLDAVRPEAVVVAANTRPSNRYPQPDLRERLERRHVASYRTDETGAVTIRLTKVGYTIRTCLASQ